MSDPIVSVQALSHRYSREWAIRDVAFDIERAGIVGLLGSNGAGKSTTMNIMCGVLYPTQGDVLIKGKSIRRDPIAAKCEIGFLPQQAPLFPEFTVDEYLMHCASLRRMAPRRIRSAIDAAKERVGVAHHSKRLIGALSGGYRQRVGLAQAILHEPALVVMDEPTNGLDPVQILEVRKLIKEIAAERTVLLSTHILPEVEVLCDDIKMIEQGRIVFEGSMEEYANVVEPQSAILRLARPPAFSALEAVAGIQSVDVLAPDKWRLHFSCGVEVAERLAAASVEEDWGLRELSFERSTLEDVFARLSERAEARAA